MIQWNASFEVGYAAIDTQHRRLVDILNLIMGAMKTPGAEAATAKALGELVDYTKTHFAMEEGLMAQHRYTDVDAHKKQHADLIAKVDALGADVKAGKQLVSSKTVMFLQNWLVDHILKSDKKLAQFLNAKPVAKSA